MLAMSGIMSLHLHRLCPAAKYTKLYRLLHTNSWQLNQVLSSIHNVPVIVRCSSRCTDLHGRTIDQDLCRERFHCQLNTLISCRQYTTEQSRKKDAVGSYYHKEDTQLSTAKKVVETSKTVSYIGIVLIGIGVTGLMFFTIGKELFSTNSPNVIYTNALKLCKSDERVIDAVGEPIKGFGETTRRGWRKHVSHLEYEKDGHKFMRMKFYIQGRYRKGTVNVEMKKNEYGVYDYRYLFVDLSGYPQLTIVIKDQR